MVCTIATGSPPSLLQSASVFAGTAASADGFSRAIDAVFAEPPAMAMTGAVSPVLPTAEPMDKRIPQSSDTAATAAPAKMIADAIPGPDLDVPATVPTEGTKAADPGAVAEIPPWQAASPMGSPAVEEEAAADPVPVVHSDIAAIKRVKGRATAATDQEPVVPPESVASTATPTPLVAQGDTSPGNATLPGVLAAQTVPLTATSVDSPRPDQQSRLRGSLPAAAPRSSASPDATAAIALPTSGQTDVSNAPVPLQRDDMQSSTGAAEEGQERRLAAGEPAVRPIRKPRSTTQSDARAAFAVPSDLPPSPTTNGAAMVALASSEPRQGRTDTAPKSGDPTETIGAPANVSDRKAGSIEPRRQDRFTIPSSNPRAASSDIPASSSALAEQGPADRSAPVALTMENNGLLSQPGSEPLARQAAAQGAHAPMAAAVIAPPVVTARPGQIGHELGVEIARRLSAGGDELLVRLAPAELGQIDVRMSFDERGGLRAVIAADSPVALDMLRRDSADLSRSLSDAGVRNDPQSLRFQGGSGGESSNGQPRNPWTDAEARTGRGRRDNMSAAEPDTVVYRHIRTSGRYDLMA